MQKIRLILNALILLWLSLFPVVYAGELFDTHSAKVPRDGLNRELLSFGVEDKKSSYLEISPAYGIFTYTEKSFSKEKGSFYGISFAHDLNFKKIGLRTELTGWSLGITYTDSSSGAKRSDIENQLFEARQLIGFPRALSHKTKIIAFSGVGLRYYKDDLSGQRTDDNAVIGIEKESHYLYSPLGLKCEIENSGSWNFSAMLEYDYLWLGKQRNDWRNNFRAYHPASSASDLLPEVVTSQKKGAGYRGSLSAIRKGDKYNFIYTVFLNYWTIGDSETVNFDYSDASYSFVHLKNKTTECGLNFQVRF